jgi:hypothetical protein
MLHPTVMNEYGKARYNEMLQAAEQHRQAKKFSNGRTFSWPKLSNLLSGRKSEKSTVVATQTR